MSGDGDPAIVVMSFMYSILAGIGVAVVSYAVIKAVRGKTRECIHYSGWWPSCSSSTSSAGPLSSSFSSDRKHVSFPKLIS